MLFLRFGRIEAVVYRKPSVDRRCGFTRHFNLASVIRRAARLNLSSKGDSANGVWRGAHPFIHPSFDVQEFRFAEAGQQI